MNPEFLQDEPMPVRKAPLEYPGTVPLPVARPKFREVPSGAFSKGPQGIPLKDLLHAAGEWQIPADRMFVQPTPYGALRVVELLPDPVYEADLAAYQKAYDEWKAQRDQDDKDLAAWQARQARRKGIAEAEAEFLRGKEMMESAIRRMHALGAGQSLDAAINTLLGRNTPK